MSRKYITTEEAAEYLRLSPRTLDQFRFRGEGPKYYKAGNWSKAAVRYTIEDLDDWLTPHLHIGMMESR